MVCSSKLAEGWPEQLCFPLAILLTKEERLALAPIYQGSLYTRLDECGVNVARSLSLYNMVTHVDNNFL